MFLFLILVGTIVGAGDGLKLWMNAIRDKEYLEEVRIQNLDEAVGWNDPAWVDPAA